MFKLLSRVWVLFGEGGIAYILMIWYIMNFMTKELQDDEILPWSSHSFVM